MKKFFDPKYCVTETTFNLAKSNGREDFLTSKSRWNCFFAEWNPNTNWELLVGMIWHISQVCPADPKPGRFPGDLVFDLWYMGERNRLGIETFYWGMAKDKCGSYISTEPLDDRQLSIEEMFKISPEHPLFPLNPSAFELARKAIMTIKFSDEMLNLIGTMK